MASPSPRFPQIPAPRPLVEEPPAPVRKGWLVAVLLVVAAIATWWQNHSPSPINPTFAPVRTATVRSGALLRTVRVSGSTSAARAAYLVAPRLRGSRSGRDSSELTLTLQRLLPGGAPVKTGQVIAEFDRQFMLLRTDDFKSSVLQQEAGLRRLRANLEIRRTQQQQRIRAAKAQADKAALDLRTAPVRSDMQIERYKMNIEEANANYLQILQETPFVDASELASIRRYEIDVIQAERELQKAEKNTAQIIYRAPMDGVLVLLRNPRGTEVTEIQEGDVIGSGQAFAEVVDTSSLVLNASLNQVDAESVKVGLEAKVHFDAFPDLEAPARLVSIAASTLPGGQRAAHVREVPLRLELEKTDERMIPNLTASADIILDRHDEGVIVPLECVFLDQSHKPFAMVQTESGWQRRPLELGLANHTEVVVESGVKTGELLAAELPVMNQP